MSDKNSYGQILKSSSIMGGSAAITMFIGMVKTKFAAVLIGTAGVGLLASFTTIQGLVQTIASLGINSSGVRDVAAAVAKDDQQAIGRAVLTLRRICWLTGTLGMLTVVALSPLIGQLTFGSDVHNLEISALGLIILLANISSGQMALIQGSRRIGDIARINMTAAAIAAIITIGFYFWLGLRGIVPALVISAVIQLILSWRFAKSVPVPQVEMTWSESFKEAGSMVKLGIAMMWTGLVSSVVSYATIAMITNQFDLHAVGIYSAAFALSGMFVNFVLQAMGADYYPRLVGVAHDKAAMNRMVNEQTEIGLLLAVPGILATLVLAPWVIQLFYTKEFMPAVGLLQWFILGCLGRVISWPMGIVMLAMGKAKWLVASETLIHTLHALMIWVGLKLFGLDGVGIAFFILYLMHTLIAYYIATNLSGFKWRIGLIKILINITFVIFVFFFFFRNYQSALIQSVGVFSTLVVGLICLRSLIFRIDIKNAFLLRIVEIPIFGKIFVK